MRITTRIALGLFLVAGLLIGALSYQLSLVERLQGINRDLSLTNLEAARVSILLVQGVEGVREFAAKSVALRDEEYREQWEAWEGSVRMALDELGGLDLAEEEQTLFAGIRGGWASYETVAPSLWEEPLRLAELDALLAGVREDLEDLLAVNQAAVAARAAGSAGAGERARAVARTATWAGLLLAGAVSLFLFLSISGPLRRLTGGTRELARGRFDHRLETSGPAELADLARDFNHMAERLDELEELKRDFVSHVSHELKTPLAAMHETVEVLLEELPGPLTPKQRHLLELSRTSSTRLSSMIGDLLEASRLEAGGVRWEPGWHDPSAIVDSVLEELAPLALEEDVRLVHLPGDPPGEVLCDGDRFREVVQNLVGNALKFSPAGGSVEISLQRVDRPPEGARAASEGTGPWLLLEVSDEGSGIPDEHKERVFEKFHQVAGKRRLRGQGVGLGLSISRRIVEAHAGAIWVEDAVGGGASLKVLLPVEPARWQGIPPEPESPERALARERLGRRWSRVAHGQTLLLLILLPWMGGCASLPGLGRSAGEPLPDVPPPVPEEVAEHSSPAEGASGSARLRAGWIHFEEGRPGFARAAFEEVLAAEGGAGEVSEALWGIALLELAEGTAEGTEQARVALVRLVAEGPEGPLRVQAGWVLRMLDEVADLRQGIRERDNRIRELNETLEMLRRIDLERRPSGAPPSGD